MAPRSLLCLAFFSVLLPSSLHAGTPGRTPRTFLANEGQWDPAILYRGASATANVSFLRNGISFSMVEPEDEEHEEAGVDHHAAPEFIVWNMLLVGANDKMRVRGEDGQPSVTNFLSGNDPSRWVHHPMEVHRIVYEEVYAGIDLHFHHTGADLKYDYVVHPGADMDEIRNSYAGIEGLAVNANGDLLITTEMGTQVQRAPVSWQVIDGTKRVVPMAFELHNDSTFGFTVRGTYDRSYDLVIDPLFELVWASYTRVLGASDNLNYSFANAMDAQGNVYITGMVDGSFPSTPGAYSGPGNVYPEVFVAKFSSDGSTLLYWTYLPGQSSEFGASIAVDALGRAYVTGVVDLNFTGETNFPSTPNAYQPVHGEGSDAFLTVLDPTGSSLVYSSFLGGTGSETAFAVALGPTGIAYITGATSVGGFPEVAATNYPDGQTDVFVAKFDIAQSGAASLLYSARIGGGPFSQSTSHGIAVDDAGNAYVTGSTGFGNGTFPVTPGAYNTTYSTGIDGTAAYLFKIGNTLPATLVYSTFLGAGMGTSVAVNTTSGEAFVSGTTYTPQFPITPGAVQSAHGGGTDAFVLRMNAAGSDVVYSTFLGGAGYDQSTDIVVNGVHEAYVVGIARDDFPTSPDALQPELAGGLSQDMWVVQLNSTGTAYGCGGSTYFGGTQDEYYGSFYSFFAPSISLQDHNGVQDTLSINATSHSQDFPTTPGVYEETKVNGISDQPVFLKMTCASSVLAPIADFSASVSSSCIGGIVDFADASANSAESWTWSFPGGTPNSSIAQDPQDIVYAAPGTYTVTLEACNVIDCDLVTQEITITAQPLPVITLGNDTILCDGSTLALSAPPGFATYAWQQDGMPLPTELAEITVDEAGTYTVLATDAAACTAADTVVVDLRSTPIPAFDVEQVTGPCSMDHVRFQAVPSTATYTWNFGDGTIGSGPLQEHHYADVGTYTVLLTVADGPCSANASQIVVVTASTGPGPVATAIPNVFSPNGDGRNDCFAPIGLEGNPECFTVEIFDRWGLRVFRSGSNNACWKGTTDTGERVPDGVYYYLLRIGDAEYHGALQVLR